jgi:hypothetical protein
MGIIWTGEEEEGEEVILHLHYEFNKFIDGSGVWRCGDFAFIELFSFMFIFVSCSEIDILDINSK